MCDSPIFFSFFLIFSPTHNTHNRGKFVKKGFFWGFLGFSEHYQNMARVSKTIKFCQK